ncbi:MAG: sulfurtransferase [Bryobacteraceae bacterium]|nr:sulfurtransferase [Bryobacteraceae bacterium]
MKAVWMMAMMASGAWAQEYLVSTEWLAKRLDDPQLVVLHVGQAKDYEAGHIPGARLLTLAEIALGPESAGLHVQLPSAEKLLEAFGKVGVGNSSRVVIYSPSITAATRTWFSLDYLGLSDRASLLDGGLAAWQAEGRPLTKDVPAVKAATLTGRARPETVADAAWIASRLKDAKVQVVDARTEEFYSGATQGFQATRQGRIPGARSVTFSTLLENGKFKSKEQLKAALQGEGKQTVSYCHIGMQATVPYFAARLAGLDVKLYDGSFEDWSRRSELPVETGR